MPINDMGGEKLPPPRYPKIRTPKDKIGKPLHCDNCNRDWIYGGTRKHYANCPSCQKPVRLHDYTSEDKKRIKVEDRGDFPLRKCKSCNYIWVFKGYMRYPHCPICRKQSTEISKGISSTKITTNHNMTCKVCGHSWMSRKENPLRCPYCNRIRSKPPKEIKSKKKKEEREQKSQVLTKCHRCGRQWGYTGNSAGPHINCPSCGTSIPNQNCKRNLSLPTCDQNPNPIKIQEKSNDDILTRPRVFECTYFPLLQDGLREEKTKPSNLLYAPTYED